MASKILERQKRAEANAERRAAAQAQAEKQAQADALAKPKLDFDPAKGIKSIGAKPGETLTLHQQNAMAMHARAKAGEDIDKKVSTIAAAAKGVLRGSRQNRHSALKASRRLANMEATAAEAPADGGDGGATGDAAA